MNKQNLRSQYRHLRHAEMSKKNPLFVESVLSYLKQQDQINCTRAIGITWPLDGEPDLRTLAELQPAPLALPATAADYSLTYHEWRNAPSKTELLGDAFSIPSPLSSPALKPNQLSLLFIPALAVDRNGMRLRYGGGCYDRLLSQPGWASLMTMAVLPQACILSTPLPADPWDLPVDGWITECGFSLRLANQQTESLD